MQCLRATLLEVQFSNQPARYLEPPVVSRRRTTVALLLFFTPYRPEKANGFSRFSRAYTTGRMDLADSTPGSSPGSPSTRRPFRLLTAAYTNYRESLCTESFCLRGKDRRGARPAATLPLRMRRSKCGALAPGTNGQSGSKTVAIAVVRVLVWGHLAPEKGPGRRYGLRTPAGRRCPFVSFGLPIREEMHEDCLPACEDRSSAHRRTCSETFARIGNGTERW